MSETVKDRLAVWYAKNEATLSPADKARYADLQIPVCHGQHETETPGELHLQNTSYESPLANHVVLCDECLEENRAYWKERWDEYYSGCL